MSIQKLVLGSDGSRQVVSVDMWCCRGGRFHVGRPVSPLSLTNQLHVLPRERNITHELVCKNTIRIGEQIGFNAGMLTRPGVSRPRPRPRPRPEIKAKVEFNSYGL